MIPDSMCAMLLTGHGGPDKLVYSEGVAVPNPGPNEVLLRATACGVNNTDIWVREGAYGTSEDPDAVSSFRDGEPTLRFPRIQGADIVGRIAAVGSEIDPGRIGERVMVDFSIYSGDGDSLADMDYFGHGRDGGFAEFVAVPADQARAVASDMSDVELATFCCTYVTGERMLERAAVTSGERVLITGASGGVGSGVIQLCRARGAVPYAIATEAKHAEVKAAGAEAAVARESADLAAAVARATDGQPIDVVVDVVVGPMFNDLLELLRPQGRYVTCGAIGGPLVQIDMRRVYLKHLQIRGSSQGTRREFARLVDYIEQGKLKALVGGVYRLSDLHRAQADFAAKAFVGKLVVVPDSQWDDAAVS